MLTDNMTDKARITWYALMREMGIEYGRRKKMIEINTKLENIEDVAKIMTRQPGEDKDGN